MPATPARISASVWNAFSGVSASCGVSVRSVQLEPINRSIGAISKRLPTESIDFVENVFMRLISLASMFVGVGARSELCAGTKCEVSRGRICQVINATGRETGRREHFRIVSRVLGEEQYVVARYVNTSWPTAHQVLGQRVAHREVLETHERAILDPAG